MIRPFRLHRPGTLADAMALAAELPDVAYYRGGTELLQVMKLGFARFEHLIDLKGIPELSGIATDPDGWIRIRAGATHREIERSELVSAAWPELAALEGLIANPRVRNAGSIGGNLCFAEPHSDAAGFLLAVDARLEVAGPEGIRSVRVDDFVLGALSTAIEPPEILTAVLLPPRRHGVAVAFGRRALLERPTVSVTVLVGIAEGVVSEARIGVGALGPRPVLAPIGDRLVGVPRRDVPGVTAGFPEQLAEGLEVDPEPTVSAEYKRHLAGVLARRAVDAAAGVGR